MLKSKLEFMHISPAKIILTLDQDESCHEDDQNDIQNIRINMTNENETNENEIIEKEINENKIDQDEIKENEIISKKLPFNYEQNEFEWPDW